MVKQSSRWTDFQANHFFENGILKLRLDETKLRRTPRTEKCVSSMQKSIYRYDPESQKFSIEKKFVQKYGWFEIRCRMPAGTGLHSAFWLVQTGAHDQEYSDGGQRKNIGTVEEEEVQSISVAKSLSSNLFLPNIYPPLEKIMKIGTL